MSDAPIPIGKTIALCSDVHGNLEALAALLAELDRLGVQGLYVAGDHLLGGAEPLEVWRRLHAVKAHLARGLGDTALSTLDPSRLTPRSDDDRRRLERFVATRAAVGELVLKALGRLPTSLRVPLADGREILLVHGAPNDAGVELSHDLSDEELSALVADDPADLVVAGGSHVPFQRDLPDFRVIGLGSVGEAPEGRNAHYVLVTPSYEGTIVEQAWVAY